MIYVYEETKRQYKQYIKESNAKCYAIYKCSIEDLHNKDTLTKEQEDFRFSKEEHAMEELKQAYDKIIQQRKDYESHRIEFNNWIEPYVKGNLGMSQKDVDKISREHLEYTKKCGVSYNGRLYIAEDEGSIFIYYYGRDFALVDYWWIFNRKERDR